MLALPGSAYLWQGEELGLPEHTTLDDAARQDPHYFRTGGLEAGRDGCRIPMPWVAHAPAFGFNQTGNAWMPQPASYRKYSADLETQDPNSTLNLYKTALRLRRKHGLGECALSWLDLGADACAFTAGDVTVVLNLGPEPLAIPAGPVLLSSAPDAISEAGLAGDSAVWLAG